MKVATATEVQPFVRSHEDKVRHAFWGQCGTRIVRPGDPSACGLVVWTGPPAPHRGVIPPNFCSLCKEVWDLFEGGAK